MVRINNTGTRTILNDVSVCVKLKKQILRENNFFKRTNKLGNLVVDSDCLSRTKNQEKHLKTFANNHI